MSDSDDTTSAAAPKPRRQRRRWLWRLIFTALILFVLLIVTVQAVLWSDLPRRLILAGLQNAVGLKVEAATVSAGWFGSTAVTKVRLTIPLDDGPVVETQRIDVQTNSLLGMLINGVEIRSVRITDPILSLRQHASGRWNIEDLIQQLGGNGDAGKADAGGGKPERPSIPAIDIGNALLRLTDRTGKTSEIRSVSVKGGPDETAANLVWKFDLNVPDQLHISGRVATGGEWRNEAKVELTNLRPLLTPFAGTAPDIQLSGKWEGRSASGIQGRLAIDRLSINGMPARGVVGVSQADGKISLRPESLELLADENQKPRLVAAGGAISYENSLIQIEQLLLRGGGGVASVSGQFSPAARTGKLQAEWTELSLPVGVSHTGKLAVTLGQTLDGRIELVAHVDTRGQLATDAGRSWAGAIDVRAAGPSFENLSAQIDLPKFEIRSDRQAVPFDGLSIKLAVGPNLPLRAGATTKPAPPGTAIVVDSVRMGSTDRIDANGFFILETGRWEARLNANRWPLPYFNTEAVAITFDAAGTPDSVSLHNLRVAAADTIFTVTGGYVYHRPNPLDVLLTLEHSPPTTADDARAIGAKPVSPDPLTGELAGRGRVTGQLFPLALEMDGELQGLRVKAIDRSVGELSIKVQGKADPHRAYLKRDRTSPPLMILGGQWEFEAFHSFDERASSVTLSVHDWPLKEVGTFLKQPSLDGTADGSWTFYAPMGGDILHDLRATGGLWAKQLKVNGLVIDTLSVPTSIEKGMVKIGPVEARSQQGVAGLTGMMSLANPKQIEVLDIKVDQWPVALPPATYLTISGAGPRVLLRLPDESAGDPAARLLRFESGPLVFNTPIRVNDIDAGTAKLTLELAGRTVRMPIMNAKLFQSDLEAQAAVNLDAPNATTASVSIRNINPEQLVKLVPGLRGLSGSGDLYAVVTPEINPNGLEPLVADMSLISNGLIYRNPQASQTAPTNGVQIGNGRFRMVMRLDPQFQIDRAVMEDQSGILQELPGVRPKKRTGPLPPNTLELANGEVRFWGRVLRNYDDRGRQGFNTLSSHLRIGFSFLDLNQLLQTAKPDGQPTPGDVDGSIILFGTTRLDEELPAVSQTATERAAEQTLFAKTIRSLQGEGALELRNSDLGRLTVIAFLYDAMGLGFRPREPIGTGDAKFRIEGGSLYLTACRYFNRGIEVRALGTVDDLYKGDQATVRATVFGSVRTLKDIRLPIIQSVVPDIEQILAAIQTGGTSVTVTGSLRQPKPKVVLFEELGRSMRELLLGDYRDANNNVPRQ